MRFASTGKSLKHEVEKKNEKLIFYFMLEPKSFLVIDLLPALFNAFFPTSIFFNFSLSHQYCSVLLSLGYNSRSRLFPQKGGRKCILVKVKVSKHGMRKKPISNKKYKCSLTFCYIIDWKYIIFLWVWISHKNILFSLNGKVNK